MKHLMFLAVSFVAVACLISAEPVFEPVSSVTFRRNQSIPEETEGAVVLSVTISRIFDYTDAMILIKNRGPKRLLVSGWIENGSFRGNAKVDVRRKGETDWATLPKLVNEELQTKTIWVDEIDAIWVSLNPWLNDLKKADELRIHLGDTVTTFPLKIGAFPHHPRKKL